MFCKRLKIGYSKKATGFQFLIAVILLHSAALVMNEIRGTIQTQTHADINTTWPTFYDYRMLRFTNN